VKMCQTVDRPVLGVWHPITATSWRRSVTSHRDIVATHWTLGIGLCTQHATKHSTTYA